jgi:hypothetical protein
MPSLFRCLADQARARAHLAAAAGDRPRFWREMAAARRLLGWFDAARDFDQIAQEPRP